MVARGLMDTPVRGWNVFHGARTTDIEAVAHAVRKALGRDQILVGVGFSMGAIILSNYVAKSGLDCRLDAAMAVSGGLDLRENLSNKRSTRLWQPLLAKGLRDDFVVNKFSHLFQQRLTSEQYLHLMRASSITVSKMLFK
jgi:predicted alpha/beta-fold hydrolase